MILWQPVSDKSVCIFHKLIPSTRDVKIDYCTYDLVDRHKIYCQHLLHSASLVELDICDVFAAGYNRLEKQIYKLNSRQRAVLLSL